MTNGQRVITGYFLIAYVVPLIGNVLYPEKIETIYQIFPLSPYPIVLFVAIYALFMLLSRVVREPGRVTTPRLQRSIAKTAALYRRIRTAFGAVALLLSWQYFASGMNSYRYAPEGEGISDLGSILLLGVNVINVVATVDLLHAALNQPSVSSDRSTYIGTLLLGGAVVLSANGTASMFLALFFVFYATFPAVSYAVVFRRTADSYLASFLKSSMALTLVVALVLGAWVVGEGIKISSLRTVSAVQAASDVADQMLRQDGFWADYPYYFLSTNSIYYYSLLFTAHSDREAFNYGGISPVVLPLKTFLFRLDYLAGRPFEILRPDPGTFSRVNYLLLTALPAPAQNPRAGSSPGLAAAFVYAFPFPVSILMAAVYLLLVSRVLDRFINPGSSDRLSPIGVLVAVSCLHGLFQSPFDMLAVLDPSTLFALLVIGAASSAAVTHAALPKPLVRVRRLWSDEHSPPSPAAVR